MDELGFPVEVVSGVPAVTTPEEIDIANAPGFRSALVEAAARGHESFVVDMSRTQFCDSAGVHALVAGHRRAEADGGAMLLVIPATAVLRILAITGVDRVIPNFTSPDEALAHAFTAGPGGRQRADGPPEGSERGGLAAERGTSGPDRQPADRDAGASVTSQASPWKAVWTVATRTGLGPGQSAGAGQGRV
jgi:anti-sigma B factor antagonist